MVSQFLRSRVSKNKTKNFYISFEESSQSSCEEICLNFFLWLHFSIYFFSRTPVEAIKPMWRLLKSHMQAFNFFFFLNYMSNYIWAYRSSKLRLSLVARKYSRMFIKKFFEFYFPSEILPMWLLSHKCSCDTKMTV